MIEFVGEVLPQLAVATIIGIAGLITAMVRQSFQVKRLVEKNNELETRLITHLDSGVHVLDRLTRLEEQVTHIREDIIEIKDALKELNRKGQV